MNSKSLVLTALTAVCCHRTGDHSAGDAATTRTTEGAMTAVAGAGRVAAASEAVEPGSDKARRRLSSTLWPRVWTPFLPADGEAVAALLRATAEGTRCGLLLPPVGWQLRQYQVDGGRLVVLFEAASTRRGQGIYGWRCRAESAVAEARRWPLMVQAPHPYFDVHTEELALAWLFESSAVAPDAMYAGSTHRFGQADGAKRREAFNPGDVAHNPDHPFLQATVDWAATTRGTVVQLHGFEEDEGARAWDIIISDGTTAPSERVRSLASALRGLGYRVALYPVDGGGLGATTNVQGRAMRQFAVGEFVHIEMARQVRDDLREDKARRNTLFAAIATALRQGR